MIIVLVVEDVCLCLSNICIAVLKSVRKTSSYLGKSQACEEINVGTSRH